MYAACSTLDDDVTRAQNYQPIPDADAQSHWAASLAHDHMAALHCTVGLASMDPAAVSLAASELDSGSAEARKAADRVDQIRSGQ